MAITAMLATFTVFVSGSGCHRCSFEHSSVFADPCHERRHDCLKGFLFHVRLRYASAAIACVIIEDTPHCGRFVVKINNVLKNHIYFFLQAECLSTVSTTSFSTCVLLYVWVVELVHGLLSQTELLDSFTTKPNEGPIAGNAQLHPSGIGFHNSMFLWSNMDVGNMTGRQFCLRIDDELLFQPGRINLIIGPSGSGKTSILKALLGEMHFMPAGPDSWFNLPRENGVAYAAQESWVQNKTIKVTS